MSLKVLRGQLQMCRDMLVTTSAMVETTIQTLGELQAENNGKPKDEAKEPVIRKAFGGRSHEVNNGETVTTEG